MRGRHTCPAARGASVPDQERLTATGKREPKRAWAGHGSREAYAASVDGWRPYNPGADADAIYRAGHILADAVRQAFATPHARGIRKRLFDALEGWDRASDPEGQHPPGGWFNAYTGVRG